MSDVRVDASFPTGNGLVTIQDNDILLDRDLRDSVADWVWYWHLKLTATQDTQVRIRLARPQLIGKFGPAVRTADHYHWLWSAEGPDSGFDLGLHTGATIYVSATIPYGVEDLRFWCHRLRDGIRTETLTTSEGGRKVLILRVGVPSADRVILLTCRHHACEAMASFVLEGALEEFRTLHRDGNPTARRSELIAVPLMDVDGVHRGDPGKTRTPWDHNRDYGPSSRYRSVSALRTMMARENRPIYALDLHTPGLRDTKDERPFVVVSTDAGDAENAHRLRALLKTTGGDDDMRLLTLDQEWNSASSEGQRCCAAWLRSLPTTRVATTIEYPNAVDRDQPVNPAQARKFGSALVKSLLAMVE